MGRAIKIASVGGTNVKLFPLSTPPDRLARAIQPASLNVHLEALKMPDLDRVQRKLARDLAGPDPTEKQVVLLKLRSLIENLPNFPASASEVDPRGPVQTWLSSARALLRRLDKNAKIHLDTNAAMAGRYWQYSINELVRFVTDAIAELELDLDLDGRSEIANVYSSGQEYQLFQDIEEILFRAKTDLLIVDPYLSGSAFGEFISEAAKSTPTRILTEKSTDELMGYVRRHIAQYNSDISVRKSKGIHDRLLISDQEECWILGGSIKDAARKKPTYLMPVLPRFVAAKVEIYNQIWQAGTSLE